MSAGRRRRTSLIPTSRTSGSNRGPRWGDPAGELVPIGEEISHLTRQADPPGYQGIAQKDQVRPMAAAAALCGSA